jgi:hypothetical protein
MRATICDLTGQLVTGPEKQSLEVLVSETCRLVCYVQTRESKTAAWEHGHFGPKAEEALVPAIKAAAGKLLKQ